MTRKRKKMIWLTIAILAILIAISASSVLRLGKKASTVSVCLKGHCFGVEVADTAVSRALGLMFRKELGEKKGMLFIFPEEGIYPFWMKNTLVPLDIVWIGSDLRVVHIEKTDPCRTEECPLYGPSVPARYVLEINRGLCEKYGISAGDAASISDLPNP